MGQMPSGTAAIAYRPHYLIIRIQIKPNITAFISIN
jgi:hypothetical protein